MVRLYFLPAVKTLTQFLKILKMGAAFECRPFLQAQHRVAGMPGEISAPIYKSGHWEIDLARRELRSQGVATPLGGRAFEILEVLVQAGGEIVNKYDLIGRVWPGAAVEENTLHVHISAVRKALGPDRELLKSVSGRGYRLLGTWTLHQDNASQPVSDPAASGIAKRPRPSANRPTNLPQAVSELIGRDAELREVLSLCGTHRLVTLTGTGGIGKTRLAFEVARHRITDFADGAWVAELAPLSDPALVPATIATALGLELAAGRATPQAITGALGSKRIMLVLDNCEHVIEAAAQMAELLLRANPTIHVIATSREPLRAEGEWVHRVTPLSVPLEEVSGSEELLSYGSVRLFNERIRAAATNFSSNARTIGSVGRICRRLEGIPLAIELAAARATTLGVEGVASGLDDLFQLLTGGRRTALPRHRTLRETLNWSYRLLTEPERIVLRRLAIFTGGFTLEAAGAIAADDTLPARQAVDCVASLAAKSLVAVEVGDAAPRYRLLEMTRAYALEHLTQAGEVDTVARRHARHYLNLFSAASESKTDRAGNAALTDHGSAIDNARAALNWSFSATGDASIGVALAAATVLTWLQLSLWDECRSRAEQALGAIETGAAQHDPRCQMLLLSALSAALLHTTSFSPQVIAVGTKALEIAESLGEIEYQLGILNNLWQAAVINGQHRNALALVQKFHHVAAVRRDPTNDFSHAKMLGISHYFLGNLRDARHYLQHALSYPPPVREGHSSLVARDSRVGTRSFLARVLWLQGMPEHALLEAESIVSQALAMNDVVALVNTLASSACPISLWIGDLPAAERYIEMLLEHSARHGMEYSNTYGPCYRAQLVSQRGEPSAGIRLLSDQFDKLGKGPTFVRMGHRLAEYLGWVGESAEGLNIIDEIIDRSEPLEERWSTAELWRIKGELLSSNGMPEAAEECLLRAIDIAREQGALSWELRAATSLARIWRDEAEKQAARELLVPVFDQFTEGFATADLRAAKSLIEELS
jgi:predicted ATPase/DNA-binding winged helix-turn-helix (wHTH) protein